MLPDDVLLAIFDFCAGDENERTKREIEAWQTLVHVCQRWRSLVFGSPRHLNLRLVCTSRTPARDEQDIWPDLPLVIQCYDYPIDNVDNIVAELERRNRVRQIRLGVSSLDLEKVLRAMQQPFPELTQLWLWSDDEIDETRALPDSFLGGSALSLRHLYFRGIPFPGLPNLLLSATHLVDLDLRKIPHSGYISPEAMVSALSALTSLGILRLGFQSPRSCPGWASRYPPPPTRFVLPVLTYFRFKGVSEYWDNLVARIDAPRLSSLDITFFNQIIFDTPQFIQFISRTPTLKALEKAIVTFMDGAAIVSLTSLASLHRGPELSVRISSRELDWQVSSLEQVCTSSLPPLSVLEDLYITEEPYWQLDWQDNIENAMWLELLHPFIAVKNLYLSEEIARRIVPALQELVGGRTTEVLPTLRNIFLEGSSHRDLFKKALGSSPPLDKSSVAL
jgi:hypothetical protein